jgi:hypothetical protein
MDISVFDVHRVQSVQTIAYFLIGAPENHFVLDLAAFI